MSRHKLDQFPCSRYLVAKRCNCQYACFNKYVEDIYFFEVNTKYISSSVLKTSQFSRVRSTSENSDVFNSRDEIYLVFIEKKYISFYFILLQAPSTEECNNENF